MVVIRPISVVSIVAKVEELDVHARTQGEVVTLVAQEAVGDDGDIDAKASAEIGVAASGEMHLGPHV
jgi:hypothetical protein